MLLIQMCNRVSLYLAVLGLFCFKNLILSCGCLDVWILLRFFLAFGTNTLSCYGVLCVSLRGRLCYLLLVALPPGVSCSIYWFSNG